MLTFLTMLLIAGFLTVLVLQYDPQRPHAQWIRHGVTGLMLLLIWNLLPLPDVGVNPVTVAVAGTLGLPGAGLVAVMGWMR